ncbi:MAG: YlxR family protein [Chloroflexi bacterium]|nr:YlxR family protein [Chloroflexota bacterium]
MAAKSIPQRTCVGCFQVRPKREMVRIVRTPEGNIEIDPTGKKNGRGAYLHRDRSCWETALEKNRLEYALKTPLGEAQAMLLDFAQSLPEPEAVGAS